MILAADNLQALNPQVAGALKNLDPHPLEELGRRLEQAGAQILDINPGYLAPRHEDRMVFMVEAVQRVTPLRLMLDSPNARVLARGLAACEKPPILNACTLEDDKLRNILPLAAAHHTDLVLLLLDRRSASAATLEGKITLALELREHALAAGIDPSAADLRPGPPQPQLARRLAAGERSGENRAAANCGGGLAGGRRYHGGALQPAQRLETQLPRPGGRGLPQPAGRGGTDLRPGRRAAAGADGGGKIAQADVLSFRFPVCRFEFEVCH